ncbi:MAG TPA: L,D-transpeptidase [Gammaproteobacteria bacterium]|nr:L,D-transpeptidase [Gammaproteobacteria bacterium]
MTVSGFPGQRTGKGAMAEDISAFPRAGAAGWLLVAVTTLFPSVRANATSGPPPRLDAPQPSVEAVTRPKTFQLKRRADLHRRPGGEVATHWEAGRLLTSDHRVQGWVRVTGYFPDGSWEPVRDPLWVRASDLRIVRPFRPKHPAARRIHPRTYRLEQDVLVRDRPRGRPVTTWKQGAKFTVHRKRGRWLEVSGYFPHGRWRAAKGQLWVPAGAARDLSPPPRIPRPKGVKRHIVVDKSEFRLKVVEDAPDGKERTVYSTKVGLGMDGCLPDDQGGRCYYTRPGDYRIRWRIYKPGGIDWCIPASMAREDGYAQDIAEGKRCFDGALGKFALNIGKSYAIHATHDRDSLGKKESHGCIRVRPKAAKTLWRYMRVGDRVTIRP